MTRAALALVPAAATALLALGRPPEAVHALAATMAILVAPGWAWSSGDDALTRLLSRLRFSGGLLELQLRSSLGGQRRGWCWLGGSSSSLSFAAKSVDITRCQRLSRASARSHG